MEYAPPNEESYLAQKQKLVDLQLRQSQLLESEGIAGLAWKRLSPSRQNLIGLLPTRLVVKRWNQPIMGTDEVISHADLCFLSVRVDSSGKSQTIDSVVPVSEIYAGMQLARHGFTHEDARTVEEMVANLEYYRNSGLLPDLNLSCTDIAQAAPLPEIHIPTVPEL